MFASQKNRGFLTIEVLLATAIFAATISATMLVAFGGQTTGADVDLGNGGLYQTVSRLEDGAASVTGSWGSYSGTTQLGSIYQSTTTAVFISPCAQLVSSNSGWTSEQSREQEIGLATIIVNVASSTELGSNCSAVPPGDWDNPDSYGSIDVGGADGTGVATRLKNGRVYALITADPSAPAKEDFIVADASDPTSPFIAAQTNTGTGLNGVAVGGDYAYVIQNDNSDQIQVIDITDPTVPILIASMTLPNITFTCSGSSKCLAGRSIAYYAGRVYVGTNYIANLALPATENNEFHVYCVSDTSIPGCSPMSPVWLGSLNINHNVNSIALSGKWAYLATSDDTAELMVVDVSDPSAMQHPDITGMKYDAKTTTGGSSDENGASVYVLGSTVYLGRERVNASTERDFYVLNAANPANVTAVGAMRLGLGSGSFISGIVAQGHFAFLVTTDSNEPFFVVDLIDPANPVNHSTCGLNFSQVTRGIAYQSNFIFTANRSNDILRIIYDQPTMCI